MGWFQKLVDDLVVHAAGSQIAIIGPRGSGKTTLYDFLASGTVAAPRGGRAHTTGVERRDRINNHDLKLRIKTGVDLPGGEGNYVDWHEQYERAKTVLYLFDAHLVRTDPQYAARVRRDRLKVAEWGTDGRRITLVGTHVDKDPVRKRMTVAEYHDSIADENDTIVAFLAKTGASIVIGSLATDVSARRLVRQVFPG